MCFSANMSIISFIVGLIGSILVYSLGGPSNKIIGLFLGFVSFMQFLEYLLWKHQECNNQNKFLSKITLWFNHMQPIVLGLLIILFNYSLSITYYVLFIIFIYTIVMIPYSMQYFRNNITNIQCTIKNLTTQHLYWKWNSLDYNYLFYSLFFVGAVVLLFYIGLPNKELVKYAILIAIFTYITSYIFYKRNAGSMWCFYTAFLPITYYTYIKLNNIVI
jgi:hypothetical protein